jgi:hypothetical protein
MQLEDRLLRSIRLRPGRVVLRSELESLGGKTQLSVALNRLVSRGVLIRIGKGVYAKTRTSSATGATVPAGSLETLATEALTKLGVDPKPGSAAKAYNAGSTQIPGLYVVNTGKRRISRKLTVGGRQLVYENDYSRAA